MPDIAKVLREEIVRGSRKERQAAVKGNIVLVLPLTALLLMLVSIPAGCSRQTEKSQGDAVAASLAHHEMDRWATDKGERRTVTMWSVTARAAKQIDQRPSVGTVNVRFLDS